LLETGVKYEEIEIDLTNKPEWYWKINQQGKVPALDFGGDILIESAVISEFVVDLFRDADLFPYGTDAASALKRAKSKQFVETFLLKINPIYYAAVVKGEVNLGPPLVEAIKKFIIPLLPEDTTFIIGDKFGLAEILVSPFVVRIFLLGKLGLLGDGTDVKLAEITKWDAWTKAIVANENVKKTFNWEAEARKAVDRIRKIREAKMSATTNGASGANGAKV